MTAVVGLTGGIASGKSTVARLFEKLGVPRVDADEVAREMVEPGSEGLNALIAAFGESVLQGDGTLDRKALGKRVFDNEQARAELNAILHPRIRARSLEKIKALCATTTSPYVLYDAALLVEKALHNDLDALVVVSASESTQLKRLCERDPISMQEAKQRLSAQLPLADKIAVADYVVDNDGSMDKTQTQVASIHKKLVERFSQHTDTRP